MKGRTDQSHSVVFGDQVGGNKLQLIIKREIAKAKEPIREEMNFETNCDEDNTTLLKKLKDGKASHIRMDAINSKKHTMGKLLKLCETEEGKRRVYDIYANLVSLIQAKYIVSMDEGELLKYQMEEIYSEFSELVIKYQDVIDIDEAFLYGLLFIATSNCAIRWKVDDEL